MPNETANPELLAALDAGIAAADAMPAHVDAAEVLTVAPVAESVEPEVVPPVDTPPVDTPPIDDPPVDTPPVDTTVDTPPVDDAAKAEADADAAAADEARKLGFKNEKGVKAFQDVHREARTAKAELATIRKQLEEEIQPRAEAFTKFRDHMDSIGCKPEQFGLAVAMIDAMNSGEPKKLEAVAQELEGQLRQVREKLGLSPAEGKELFDAYPDLAQEVADGDITAKRANELARVRRLEEADTAHANATRERAAVANTETEQLTAAVQEAAADLDALGAHLSKIDPNFAQKVQPALDKFLAVRDTIPPHKWEAKFRLIYDEIPNPTPKPKTPAAGTVPLRGSGAASGTPSAVSTTAMDALNAGLEAARQGVRW
jgi:hypothetical protein